MLHRVVGYFKHNAGTLIAALVGALLFAAAATANDPYAPFGGFGQGNIATTQSGCADLGAGLGIVNNVQVCIPASIGEAITLTAASTAFTVNNNATISGTLTTAVQNGSGLLTLSGAGTALSVTNNATISGTATIGTAAVTTLSGTPNFSGTPTFGAGAGLGTGTYSGAATFSGADTFSAAGTALTVTNNSLFSGTQTTTGLATFNGSPTSISVAHNASVSGLLSAGGGISSGTYNSANFLNITSTDNTVPQIVIGATGGAEEDYAATTAPGVVYKLTGGAGMGSSSKNYCWDGTNTVGTELFCMLGNGNWVNDTGNNVLSGTTAGIGQYLAGNATKDSNMTGGAYIVGSGGMYEQGTTYNPTVVHNSGTNSTLTMTQWGGMLKSSSTASDVTFTITFPLSTRTNPPLVLVTSLISGTALYITAESATGCTITSSTGIGASTNFANVLIFGNGP